MNQYGQLKASLGNCAWMKEQLPAVKQLWEQFAWEIDQLPDPTSGAELIFDALESDADWVARVNRMTRAMTDVQRALEQTGCAGDQDQGGDQGGAEQQQQPAATKPHEQEDAEEPYELPYSRPDRPQQPEQPRPVERPKPSAGLQQRMQQRPSVTSKPPAPPPKKGGKR